jgi:hypothetical protein
MNGKEFGKKFFVAVGIVVLFVCLIFFYFYITRVAKIPLALYQIKFPDYQNLHGRVYYRNAEDANKLYLSVTDVNSGRNECYYLELNLKDYMSADGAKQSIRLAVEPYVKGTRVTKEKRGYAIVDRTVVTEEPPYEWDIKTKINVSDKGIDLYVEDEGPCQTSSGTHKIEKILIYGKMMILENKREN